jgi:two-component sensor histidine kinase
MTDAQTFRGEPASAAAARRFATQAVADVAPDAVEAIELMVSELATNCIRHTQTEFEVRVERSPDGIRIEVTDDAGGTPELRSPAIDEPTGRGLRIIELLSDAWGVDFAPEGGKTVWFTLATVARACA